MSNSISLSAVNARGFQYKRQQDTEWTTIIGFMPVEFAEPTVLFFKELGADIVHSASIVAGKYHIHANERGFGMVEVK